MLSLRKYMTLSVVAASAVIYHAFATRRQFFPTTVYLSTSKLAVAAVGNLSFAMALCMYNLVIKIFLGTLREIELERVKEKLSSAIMETCLALTIFREEFNIGFVGMFTVLTFVKVFHWLVEDRVDYIEVTPSVSRLAHVRIVSFLLVLLGMDVLFLHHTIAATLDQKGHSVQLLFAFEYIILASTAAATLLKYLLSMLDSAMEGRWEGKGTYVFYLELLKDMMHLFVYCIFFIIVFSNYGLPLHLIRDLYMTFRNFKARIADFLRFRQVTARMDRFPDATAQDLARCDGICIICREEMAQQGLNKKLHCGHVFHLHCLRSWLERQQNCPTCRMSVFRPPPAAVPAAAPGAAAPEAAAAAPGAAAGAGEGAAQGPAPAAGGAAGAAAGMAAPGAAGGVPAPRPPSRSGRPSSRASAGGHRSPGAAAGAAGVPPAAGAAAGGVGAAAAAGALGAGAFPVFQPGAGPSSSRRERGGEGSSSRAGLRRAGSGAAAAGPGGADAAAAAAGIPAGFWPGNGAAAMPAAGLMWQMPQWYPVTSMAAFTNTPLQYAGQQSAVDQAQALAAASMVPMVPAIIPAISAPFSAVISPPVSMAPNATPEQAQAAAAAAMAAAAAAAMYMPPMMPGLALMPPAMLPGGAAPGSAQEQMAAAAAANAAAAAAAAVMGGAATPEVMQASFEATQQMLQRQLDYLQSQMSRIRSSGGADVAPAAGTAPPAAAAAAAPAVGGGSAGATAGASSSLAATLQQPDQAAAPGAAGPSGALQSGVPGASSSAAAAATGAAGSGGGAAAPEEAAAPAASPAAAAAASAAPAAATANASSSAEAGAAEAGAGTPAEQQQQQQVGAGAVHSQAGEEAGAETAEELRQRRLQRFAAEGNTQG